MSAKISVGLQSKQAWLPFPFFLSYVCCWVQFVHGKVSQDKLVLGEGPVRFTRPLWKKQQQWAVLFFPDWNYKGTIPEPDLEMGLIAHWAWPD